MKLIYAANHRQATYWVRQLGWDPKEYTYVHDAQQLRGIPAGTELHRVGRWSERPYDYALTSEIHQQFMSGHLIQIWHDAETGVVIETLDRSIPG